MGVQLEVAGLGVESRQRPRAQREGCLGEGLRPPGLRTPVGGLAEASGECHWEAGSRRKLGPRPQLGEGREDPDPSAPRGALPKRRWVVGASVALVSPGKPPSRPPVQASGPCSRKGGRQLRAGGGAVGDAPTGSEFNPHSHGRAQAAQVIRAVPRPEAHYGKHLKHGHHNSEVWWEPTVT